MFRDKLQIPKERLELYYSIGVIMAIPAMIVANTLIISTSVQKNYDTELRRKADLANGLIASSITPIIDQPASLQQYVKKTAADNPELNQISIVKPMPGGMFSALASSENNAAPTSFSDIQLSLAVSKRQSIAQLTTGTNGERSWNVGRPILQDNTVIAVVSTASSLKDADALIANTLLQSIGIVTLTAALSILLLANHFKFVEYAVLFRRQKEVDQLK
ncbi:MAG TPA: hypothetical protein VK983_05895, partial [Candidatus Limnocylindrales bacterium]|nr:hypothetical protein [Candidatus Limnocylindrales bacterium]